MNETAAIRLEERFDEGRVAEFLVTALDGFVPPVRFAQFPGGKANLTYLAVDADDAEVVLRRPPLGDVAPGSHDMAREHRVLSRLWQKFDKAPRAFAFCEDPDVMGKPFFVMERRHGTVIREQWPYAEPQKRHTTATSLVDALAELHEVDFDSIGLGSLGKPEGFVERQVDGWRERWHRAKTRDVADMDRVAEMLEATPRPQRATLIHNDFKLDNTMVDGNGAVSAVFDWDMATLGDPLTDLGTTLAYWTDPDSPTYRVFGQSAAELSPYLSKREAAQRYAVATGLDLVNLDYYVALAYFRIAVIIEQIFARYHAGQTTDSRFAELGELVPPLASEARRAFGK